MVDKTVGITQVLEGTEGAWENYVNKFSEAHLYFDYKWKQVLEQSFGHKCFYMIAQKDGNTQGIFPLVFIKGKVMPAALVSIPFFNYGGMLADNKEVESAFLKEATNILKNTQAKYLEVRNIHQSNMLPITREHKVTMWLELFDDIDSQWGGLDAKVRNQIRKAQKSGLKIKKGKKELLDEFYRVFSCNMRDLGTPVIGKKFFNNILKYFSEKTRIFIVEFEGQAIAGAFTLYHHGITGIPWASSIKRCNKLCPNEFMYWEAIMEAISLECKWFDFGRCTKETGTYRFKKQWKPQVKQLYWQYYAAQESMLPQKDSNKKTSKILIAIWKRLPLFLANRLGPGIAKYIPIF